MSPESALENWKRLTYIDELPEDIVLFRKLLEDYSKVPPSEIDELLLNTRKKLWEVAMYPCIGRWSFLNLRNMHDDHFLTAFERLKNPAGSSSASGSTDTLLDIGCCVGQVLRKLVRDGIEPTRLFGTDLHPEFITIGAELFNDAESGLTFVAGDMLNPEDTALKELDGKITLVHAANFFHLFKWEEQVKVGTRITRFLQPGTVDAVIFGRQIGTHKPREREGRMKSFLHNEESLQKLWDEIGSETGTRWRVDVSFNEERQVNTPGFGEEDRYIRFGIYQLPPQ
ncbi:Methyltransferase trt5 [Trichoderma ghanense]|uniref:Methyltransferase trt5 n=1 Tax=Trichoderma ghanense TaxID=65468 RepID=A0ABY2GWU9_9HYPO